MDYGFVENGNILHGEPIVEGYDPGLYTDAFSQGEFVHVKSIFVDHGDQFGVSSVAFDCQEELLWMGNMGGHLTSYYGLQMQKYTSFQVHMTNEVRHMLSWDRSVFSLTADSLHCSSKCGIPLYHYRSPSLCNMQCMLLTAPNMLLMGGHQSLLVAMDVETRQEVHQVELNEAGCAILRAAPTFLCCGDTSGKVTLLDPLSLSYIHQLDAHSGTLSDFDVCGNQLITCGFSSRNGTMTVDRLLMVYDLRYMKKMTPLQLTIDPILLRFIPTYSNRICVVSQTGAFQVLEQGLLTQSPIYQLPVIEGAMITSFDLSSTNQVLAFGDACGYLHMFSANIDHQPTFNEYSAVTEFATPFEPPIHPISFSDERTPYSIIPTPYPRPTEVMLSEWPDQLCTFGYRKPAELDPELVRTLKPRNKSPVLYAPRPASQRANQIPYELGQGRGGAKTSQAPTSPMERGDVPARVVPKQYQKVEIKYSKLGVEDFDFRYYNKTNFAGLETHIPNAYCNAMLQVLYFVEPLRCTLLSHICEREFCLSCELGYLFHMLDQQKGKTCQATNFLRAFRTIPEASALGLILNDAEEAISRNCLPRLIQNWNRFVLQQIDSELSNKGQDILKLTSLNAVNETLAELTLQQDGGKTKAAGGTPQKPATGSTSTTDTSSQPAGAKPKEATIVRAMFGYNLSSAFICCKCGDTISRSMSTTVTDLTYPETNPDQPMEKFSFSEIVERSMCMDVNTQTWCVKCNNYQPHTQSKVLESLPDVLSLNCHLENDKEINFWKQQEELVRRERESDPNNAMASMSSMMSAQHGHSSKKPCRYGPLCTRADCRFLHDTSQSGADHRPVSGPPPPRMAIGFDDEGAGESWVPLGLTLKLTPDGKVHATNIQDDSILTPANAEPEPGAICYELVACVAYIREVKTGGNLVAHILAGERYHKRKEGVTHKTWYLFNDFAITPTEKFVSVNFDLDWKLPCILYFTRTDLVKRHDVPIADPISSQVLFINASLVTPRRKTITFVPLDENELPKAGDIVGLDAEFVTLNAEEAELRSDGTRSTIKPSQMSVARVTCIREKGPLQYVPFIDDYISTQEQVVDYLTQFSGIQPGDLDATLSSKHLTTLKSTYLKLRYLISCKVLFVGHGLKKDFRVLNLVVPQDQVVDTVDLFHLPRQRMISLKFLAWLFLGIKIQSQIHDSIEDAVTAIRLYYKYDEICKQGSDYLNAELNRMYEVGRKYSWQIPEDDELVD